jgi:hypothetical protein
MIRDASRIPPSVWRSALRKVRAYAGVQPIRHVLLAGSGIERATGLARSVFRRASVTCIASDEEGTEEGTARGIEHTSYDVIAIDVSGLGNPRASELSAGLAADGYCIVVGAPTGDHVPLLPLTPLRTWRIGEHGVALYQHPNIRNSFREGYLPVKEWPELDPVPMMQDLGGEQVGDGVYWRFGPFSFEKYYGDREPDSRLLDAKKKRMLHVTLWQRRTHGITPPGWISFTDAPAFKIGYVSIKREEYWKNWSETARRYLKKWRAEYFDSAYSVETVSYEAFAERYRRSTLPMTLRGPMLYEMRIRMKNPGTPVTFYAARNVRTGKIAAGIATMRSKSVPSSYYIGGFFMQETRHVPVITGLFDRWFSDERARGVRFIEFGNFWHEGADSSWKGFSRFKAKFNPLYFFYPPLLCRFEFRFPGF